MKIRVFFTNLYYSSSWARKLLNPILQVRNALIPLEKRLRMRFSRILGYPLNLSQPKSLNEKIQWLKLNDRSVLHVSCADKYKVRGYVSNKIGEEYLVPLIHHTTNPETILPKNLPNYPIILKNSHDSGGVTIVRDKNTTNWQTLRKKLSRQLKRKYAHGKGEWQYHHIEPRILIEDLLMNNSGQIPPDLKFHVMNGRVAFIQVDMDRETSHKRNLHHPNWDLIPCSWRYENGKPIDKPQNLSKMIVLAEKLAGDFIYVRVDLYNVCGKIYFGELTFHSESGFGKFSPKKWDFQFGELLRLPIESY